MHDIFRKFSHKISELVGSPWAFIVAFLVIILWAVSGPIFGYSDTWQLVINTGTTIVTFLMVFLIQNTQNRDNKAIHLKLDELIVAQKNARNSMVDLEDLSDEEIQKIQAHFNQICSRRATQTRGQAAGNEDYDENNDNEAQTEVRNKPAGKIGLLAKQK